MTKYQLPIRLAASCVFLLTSTTSASNADIALTGPERKILIEFNDTVFEGVKANTKEPEFHKVLQEDLNNVSKELKLPRAIQVANMSRFSNIGAVWYPGGTSNELRRVFAAVRARPYVKAANFDGRIP